MRNKDCPCEESLFLYMDSQLEEKDLKEIEEHIAICPSCKRETEFLKKFEKDFQADIPLPEDFTCKVMGRIKQSGMVFYILSALMVTLLFTVLFFSLNIAPPLPAAGEIIVRLFVALRDISSDIWGELFRQNTMFFFSYITLLMAVTLFFILKKKTFSAGNLIISGG